MIFDTTTRALQSAGLEAHDLDGIVLSGNDEIDGRVISIMPSTGPAGGVDRDTTMIASSGDHALIYGYLRLKAGQGKNVLVVGWAKPSESVDPNRAELMAAEPYLLRQVGMNNTIAAALQASTWVSPADVHISNATTAWPLEKEDLPGRGDSVHAAVLAVDGEFTAGEELAWIVDTGWSTVSYEIGTRDLGDLSALRFATEQIARRSPDAAPERWDAVEIGGDSEYTVQAVRRTLSVRENAEINASGSLQEQLTSPHVAGLGRMLAAIRAVGKSADNGDGAHGGRIVAGVGFNGYAGQGASVMVFSNSKGATA
ncbi:hypothetical protein QFZ69_004707 [Arthrobacter sp. V1I7]|uniref:hypothetical protein n=1 Tax=Arthrobacter sp. V1I7 TaxID=3042274 RepID=UPI0027806119|nr:hypothetical protein [Arthrobacter sp. V1I7]MDQ0823761.1 hypothetical protein [Arthrobacter sp. V1I7]